MAAHLSAVMAADTWESYASKLETHGASRSQVLQFAASVIPRTPDTPVVNCKLGVKEVTKFNAQTICTVAKLHDHFAHASAKGSGSRIIPENVSEVAW